METFEQANYNVHEHNHTEWSDERLAAEAERVAHLRKTVGYVGERALQMAQRAELTLQEQMWRYAEKKNQQVEEAWSEHNV